MQRRGFLMATGLAGCALGEPPTGSAGSAGPAVRQPALWLVHQLRGGYLAPVLPAAGAPAGLASGMFVRWVQPSMLALRGLELLVGDLGTGRLWRTDIVGQRLSGVAGAPMGLGTVLAMGPDLSAWVLDPASQQVLRFARDGRLLQSHRPGLAVAGPATMALADGGATLLLANGHSGHWVELRAPGGVARPVPLGGSEAAPVGLVSGLAVGRRSLFVLDQAAGLVFETSRDGQVHRSLGRGELRRPTALALDPWDRAYVLDAHDHTLCQFGARGELMRWSARDLGVTRPVAIAVDGLHLAVADAGEGLVVVHRLGEPLPT